MGTGSFPGVECCRGVTLTPHPVLVPRSKHRVELYLHSPKGSSWPVKRVKHNLMQKFNSVHFDGCLMTCNLNSTNDKYKVSKGTKNITQKQYEYTKRNIKQGRKSKQATLKKTIRLKVRKEKTSNREKHRNVY
jgi:hypothetical protein